jgi:hypothetical protein
MLEAGILVIQAALHDYMGKEEVVSLYRKLADVSEQWLKGVKQLAYDEFLESCGLNE